MAIGINDAIPSVDVEFKDLYTCMFKVLHTTQECDLKDLRDNYYYNIYTGKDWYELDEYKNVRVATLKFDSYTPPNPSAVAWNGTPGVVINGLTSAQSVSWDISYTAHAYSPTGGFLEASCTIAPFKNGSLIGGGSIANAYSMGSGNVTVNKSVVVSLDGNDSFYLDIDMDVVGVGATASYFCTIVGPTTAPTATLLPRRIFPYGINGAIGAI